jgi:hypothetical protein
MAILSDCVRINALDEIGDREMLFERDDTHGCAPHDLPSIRSSSTRSTIRRTFVSEGTQFITAKGGKVLDAVYAPLNSADFSSFLHRADVNKYVRPTIVRLNKAKAFRLPEVVSVRERGGGINSFFSHLPPGTGFLQPETNAPKQPQRRRLSGNRPGLMRSGPRQFIPSCHRPERRQFIRGARSAEPERPDRAAGLKAWNGIFAAGDWRAKRGPKTTSPRRDRKSETTTREKWPQKRLFW